MLFKKGHVFWGRNNMKEINIKDLNVESYIDSLNKDKMNFVLKNQDRLFEYAKNKILKEYGLEMEFKYAYAYKESIQIIMQYSNDSDLVLDYVFYSDFEHEDNIEEFEDLMYFKNVIINYLIFKIHKDYMKLFTVETPHIHTPTSSFYKDNIYVSSSGEFPKLYEAFMANKESSVNQLLLNFYEDISNAKNKITLGIEHYTNTDLVNEKTLSQWVEEEKQKININYFEYYFVLISSIMTIPGLVSEKEVFKKEEL